jgi:hypothetical protein
MPKSNGGSERQALAHQSMSNFGGTYVNGSWQACIRVNGRNKYLGRFPTSDEAKCAYVEAAIRYGRPITHELMCWYRNYTGENPIHRVKPAVIESKKPVQGELDLSPKASNKAQKGHSGIVTVEVGSVVVEIHRNGAKVVIR